MTSRSDSIKKKILQNWNDTCIICGENFSVRTMTFEHIIPRHRATPGSRDNLAPSHYTCNRIRDCESLLEGINRIEFIKKMIGGKNFADWIKTPIGDKIRYSWFFQKKFISAYQKFKMNKKRGKCERMER